MSERSKRIFLIVTILGSFAVYCLIYYAQVLRDAPYNFKEFKSFVFKYGTRDSMLNYYNSVTGEYNYVNDRDSLVKTHLTLTQGELDTLHKAARILGFWDFPNNETMADSTNPAYKSVPRYIIQYNYARKNKHVVYDANFNGPDKLVEANKVLIKDIQSVLTKAEQRQNQHK